MIKTLFHQIGAYKKDSILTPIYAAAEVIMEILIPFVTAAIIDEGIQAGNMQKVLQYGVIMIVLALLSLFFGIQAGRKAASASTGFACNLRESMYRNIQTFSFSNIDKFSTAGLVTRMTTDVTNMQNAYQMILRIAVRAPMTLICSMVMCFIINVKLSLIFLVALCVLAAALIYIMMHAMPVFQEVFSKYDDLNASVQENVTAIRVVKAFVREDFENQKFGKAAEVLCKLFVKAESIIVFNAPIMMTVIFASMLGLSWIGAQLIVAGDLTTGNLMSLFSYVLSIMMSLMMLSMIFVMLTMSTASAKRIVEVLNEKADLTDPQEPLKEVKDGSIDFNHVSFSYKAGTGEDTLKDINLHIHAGETIGIIGGTGSGKSSLVNLIPRFYDPQEGTVKVNGINAKDYPQGELCSEIGVVQQRSILFKGSIRDNLKWGNDQASDEDLWKAITIAQAKDIVEAKLGKLDSEVEQNGRNLSGGQKQRLTIARALVSKPEILILDDSLSALDFATDAALRKAIGELEGNVTTFLVSQRISGIRQADKILVMEDGELAGQGTHEELMETCETYQEIYYSQFPEERPVVMKTSEKTEKGAAE